MDFVYQFWSKIPDISRLIYIFSPKNLIHKIQKLTNQALTSTPFQKATLSLAPFSMAKSEGLG